MQLSTYEQGVLNHALRLAEKKLFFGNNYMDCPEAVRDYLKIWAANNTDREVFGIIWLTTKNQVIVIDELFKGDIDRSAIHLRPIVAKALFHDAASAVLFHNHPSGDPTPSNEDFKITEQIVKALRLVSVRVNDHFVIGRTIVSFAELGKMTITDLD